MKHRQALHAAIPRPSHDENARQDFVHSLRQHLRQHVAPGNFDVYRARVAPAFAQKHGRPPQSVNEVRRAMVRDPYYQFWSAMQRGSQEMMWDSVIDTVERHAPALAARVRAQPGPLGSLRIESGGTAPRYHTAYDIHLQPGGYHSDHMADDVSAGAIYDIGVPLYGVGIMGPENDATGETVVAYYRTRYPDRRPLRILDLGCAIGNSTVPWARAFPDAQVHGIDVGAPCLRYGHLRANALGVAIHLSQQDAEATDFESGTFDVVASALLFHETSRSAVGRILRECHRLLKPGGVMVHLDGFRTGENDPLVEFLGMWEVYNNNEAFLKTLMEMDLPAEARRAGWPAGAVRFEKAPFAFGSRTAQQGEKSYLAGFMEVPVLVGEK